MFMVFKSDASVQRKGFRAIHSTGLSFYHILYFFSFVSFPTVCGGRLIADTNVDHLYSHAKFGDHDYDKKEECEWIIEAAEGRRVRLLFLSFEIEHEQGCGYDFVELFDGEDDSSPLLGRFCGNTVSYNSKYLVPHFYASFDVQLPPEFLSSGESLLLRFHSDDTIHSKGFSVAYRALEANEEEQVIRKEKALKAIQRTSSVSHHQTASAEMFRKHDSRFSQPTANWRMG